MKFYWVRHGQTRENRSRIVQGQNEGRLTPLGWQQARKVGERFKDESIDAIYCSDLARAMDTCSQIEAHHPETPVAYTALLRERHGGIYQGGPSAERNAALDASGLDWMDWQPPQGERGWDVLERANVFFDLMLKKHEDETVLAVSHGGVITVHLAYLFGAHSDAGKLSYKALREQFHPKNTAVSEIHSTPSGLELITLNCTSHLES